jgi:hypothetical protein
MRIRFAIALVCAALPAIAQTTTTVTTDPPPEAAPPPPPRTRVSVDTDTTTVETRPSRRAPVAVVASDALYGGLAGLLVGGGVTLIDQGNHWDRDLMIGAGAGIIAGAVYGIYEVASASSSSNAVLRAAADRNPAASNLGFAVPVGGHRF